MTKRGLREETGCNLRPFAANVNLILFGHRSLLIPFRNTIEFPAGKSQALEIFFNLVLLSKKIVRISLGRVTQTTFYALERGFL